MEDRIVITAKRLIKTYNGQRAVDGIDFQVGKGEVFGIIGPNGAGKTTTLKMISGLIPPTQGQTLMNGQVVSIDNIAIKKIIGYLPEDSPLYENMKTRDYLRFFAAIHDIGKEEADRRIDKLLQQLNLKEGNKRLGTFSKGMKRKVAIARSLINDPQILIYDEPASGLDPQTAHYIIGFIRTMKDRGKTIIFSGHNLAQVENICDRVLIMKGGIVAAYGTIAELKEQYGTTTYSITYESGGSTQIQTIRDMDEMNRAVRDIVNDGGSITDVSVEESDLEEIFLGLVGVGD
ncbi:MAG: ABC transporter ATP-binding protein [Methanosarcinales archaeon]|nr:ABC transporter ATP-binding protein [ANME-2 cluster archaeon]MDF1530815.1 ABC transporter ATP-binding protein [ANME-2 cluster archaeon]MDW7776472.1 ABC transporter ATP-binding protein [Methanosarcinales archaeon]